MKQIAVLLTVHNRRENTLQCLHNLFAQDKVEGYTFDVWLTDDGCTDGTAEAVEQAYPEVHIIKGDGNLFWNRGMYKAWETAASAKDYDYFLWLNDDTNLLKDALVQLLQASEERSNKAIIVGETRSVTLDKATYGGYAKGKLLSPNGKLQACETFNGNCVLIPSFIFKKVGNLDWTFRHAIGDMDYGYRTKRSGLQMFVAPQYVGYCENNPKLPAWARKEVSLKKRIKNLYSPLGYAEPIPFFHFERKNFGLAKAIKHFISIHIRVLFPQLWQK